MDAFWNYIQKIQQKPEVERRGIALVSSITIALLIGVIWFGSSFIVAGPEQTSTASVSSATVGSPISVIGKELSVVAESIKLGVTELTTIISNSFRNSSGAQQ